MAGAAAIYYALPYGYFAPDQIAYVLTAKAWVFYGRHKLASPMHGNGWNWVNVGIVATFDHPLVIAFISCLAGAFAAVPAFVLSKRLGAGRAALVAAGMVAFFPSTLLWSAMNLKDSSVYLVVLCALLVISQLQRALRLHLLVLLFALVLIVHTLRPLPDAALLITAVLSVLAGHWGRRLGYLGAGTLAAAVALVVAWPAAAQAIYVQTGLSQIAPMRRAFGVGARSAVDVDPGLQTVDGAIRFFPQGLVDFFLRPFPWEGGSTMSLLTSPEMVLWYVLIPVLGFGAVVAFRRVGARALPPVAYVVITGVSYSFVISNLGTIYRERDQLLIVMFLFLGPAAAAIGRQFWKPVSNPQAARAGGRAHSDAAANS